MEEGYDLETIEQLRAISETTRWRMLDLLAQKPMTGAQLARVLKIPRPRAHYHLKILERVGLVVFLEERMRNQMIERYYVAIAKHFWTSKLLSKAKEALNGNSDHSKASEALRQIIQAMLDMVQFDISQSNPGTPLIEWNYHYQNEAHLTRGQYETIREELIALSKRIDEADRKNQVGPGGEKLLNLRYTSLLTPTLPINFDSNGSNDSDTRVSMEGDTE